MEQPWFLLRLLSLLIFSWVFTNLSGLMIIKNKPNFYLRYVDDILAAFNEQDSFNFLDFLNKRHPNIKFTVKNKLTIPSLFLMYSFQVSIIKISHFKHITNGPTQAFSSQSFTLFSYKISFIKCLIDRSFKICNNWNCFHSDIESIKSNLIKNTYPSFLIDKVIKKYLNFKCSNNLNQLKDTSYVYYLKLPYIGNLSHQIKNKFLKLCKDFRKENVNIKLVFTSFKIKNYFSHKDPIPDDLKFSQYMNLLGLPAVLQSILAKL